MTAGPTFAEEPSPQVPARPPEITDRPPSEVTELLWRLSDDLDRSSIPPKMLDRNVLIATWNIRAFGRVTKKWRSGQEDSPKRDLKDLRCIAQIISRFDVVALQEVRGDLQGLRYVLKALGPEWGLILTDVTKGRAGNDERMAFVFDTRRVRPSGLACELVVPVQSQAKGVNAQALNRQFARTPYAVSFLSAGRTFILVTLHVIYGQKSDDRLGELREIAQWLAGWATEVDEYSQNLIALGDFNIDREGDSTYQAFTSTGLRPPAGLSAIPRTIFTKPGEDTDHFFDQIAWFPDHFSMAFSGQAGGYDFVPVLQDKMPLTELSWRLSDHRPLWACFSVRL
ncbi:MAG TPA: endonuclease/exonuclease/phosphatase family protein [Actinomycetes bacterium]|nr:endonuclease/exonuclease/phosphatase family protein [Actinomycetes bacterium]